MATAGFGNVTKKSEWGPRDPSYTLKKLHEALHDYDDCIGVTGDRLYDAYLSIHLLTAKDFPEPLQPLFKELLGAMTFRHDTTKPGEQGFIGDARNTLKGMDPVDCQRILYLLTDLISEVERSIGHSAEGCPRPSHVQPSAS